MTSSSPGPSRLRIHSDHDEARRARHWVTEQINAAGFPGSERAECVLAFGEALSNVVRHAYRGMTDQPIDIEVQAFPDHVNIVIRDQAPGAFSPAPAITAPQAETLAEGGYGIYLIRQLMDEVTYVRTAGGFNEIHLTKHAAPARRAAS